MLIWPSEKEVSFLKQEILRLDKVRVLDKRKKTHTVLEDRSSD